ncbi:PAS domain-containing protein [Sneathiella chinensis]|uniref:PAS domain-containing protein n=1 Tax=Sneathiella chinensis TaxID=349750 RepID=A0ABQ5U8I2_9PROT|nr:PAS domain-containing protein [Sneathiella chinensis]GLQ07632.1 hypothetical protein GCM10007924_28530 [Sneathiella chinensis]
MTAYGHIDWQADDIAEFVQYWRGVQGEGGIPRQSDIDPAEIRHLLPGVAICEMRASDHIHCRLVGTGLVHDFGRELTDSNFLDMWQDSHRGEVYEALQAVTSGPCGILVTLAATTECGLTLTAYAVGLPLLDGEGDPNRLIFHVAWPERSGSRVPREDKVETFAVARRTFFPV